MLLVSIIIYIAPTNQLDLQLLKIKKINARRPGKGIASCVTQHAGSMSAHAGFGGAELHKVQDKSVQ